MDGHADVQRHAAPALRPAARRRGRQRSIPGSEQLPLLVSFNAEAPAPCCAASGRLRRRKVAVMARGSELLLAPRRPPPVIAVLIAVAAAALATALVYPLKAAAPVVSLGVAYLLAVLVVSTYVGFAAGLLTALLSTVAFNFFHLPPLYHLTVADSEYWVALAAFVIAAAVASRVADVARSTARDADQQRREADLAADVARALVGPGGRPGAVREGLRLVAAAGGGGSGSLEVAAPPGPPGRGATPLPPPPGGPAGGRPGGGGAPGSQ